MPASPLTEEERSRYAQINEENVNFLHRRYNRVGRWVVADILRRSAYRYPKKPALIYQDRVFTYEELESKTNQIANALLALGLQKYDRVAILAHNTPHHVLTWLGTIKAGGIYLAINYLLRGKDIAYCLNHSESKIFIVEDALYPLVEEVKKDLSSVKTFIWSNQGKGEEAPAGWLSFDSWCASAGSAVPDVELDIHDPVQMVYTSGTEALPKAVVLTNQSLLSQYVGCIIDGDYTSADVCVNALPIFHCAQRDVFLNPCFLVGATNILLFQADPKAMLEAVQQHRATMLFCPPTVWIGLLRYPGSENYDLSSLGKCYYGASIMPVEVLKELLERIPKARFYNYYGQTELAPYHTILKP
ncbi:MAG: AMP-binding protein, partial [Desulfotomaculales bacterium]